MMRIDYEYFRISAVSQMRSRNVHDGFTTRPSSRGMVDDLPVAIMIEQLSNA